MNEPDWAPTPCTALPFAQSAQPFDLWNVDDTAARAIRQMAAGREQAARASVERGRRDAVAREVFASAENSGEDRLRHPEPASADQLDAPVSGGEVGAKAATLSIMVGGCPNTFERALPLFQAMGKNITRVGGNGDGQTAKVANQIIVALNIAAVGEALLFASKAGADPAKVRQALMGGFASSRILEVHGERMIKRTFNPGFRIGLHQKDLSLALAGARAIGVALPQTAGAAQLMQACAANGMQDLDHSALVRAASRALAAHHPGQAHDPIHLPLNFAGQRRPQREPRAQQQRD